MDYDSQHRCHLRSPLFPRNEYIQKINLQNVGFFHLAFQTFLNFHSSPHASQKILSMQKVQTHRSMRGIFWTERINQQAKGRNQDRIRSMSGIFSY